MHNTKCTNHISSKKTKRTASPTILSVNNIIRQYPLENPKTSRDVFLIVTKFWVIQLIVINHYFYSFIPFLDLVFPGVVEVVCIGGGGAGQKK